VLAGGDHLHVPWSEIIEDPEELRAYFAGLEAYFVKRADLAIEGARGKRLTYETTRSQWQAQPA
jgi:hypothetical protein